jgi:chromosome segregation and condensation protein ScpB
VETTANSLPSDPEALDQMVGAQAVTTSLKTALLACLTGQESRRWTILEICERLNNFSIPCSNVAAIGALGELALDLARSPWAPWTLIEIRSEWILQPKSELLALLSGIRQLPPKSTAELSEDDKAVLLVVIGHRRRGGVSRTRIGEILHLDAGPHLDQLEQRELVYTAPDKELNWWRPAPAALLALGLRSYTEIPELKELERWFDTQKTFHSHAEKLANVDPLLEKVAKSRSRKRQRQLVRRSSAPGSDQMRLGSDCI